MQEGPSQPIPDAARVAAAAAAFEAAVSQADAAALREPLGVLLPYGEAADLPRARLGAAAALIEAAGGAEVAAALEAPLVAAVDRADAREEPWRAAAALEVAAAIDHQPLMRWLLHLHRDGARDRGMAWLSVASRADELLSRRLSLGLGGDAASALEGVLGAAGGAPRPIDVREPQPLARWLMLAATLEAQGAEEAARGLREAVTGVIDRHELEVCQPCYARWAEGGVVGAARLVLEQTEADARSAALAARALEWLDGPLRAGDGRALTALCGAVLEVRAHHLASADLVAEGFFERIIERFGDAATCDLHRRAVHLARRSLVLAAEARGSAAGGD